MKGETNETFVASRGWFERFKNRHGWHSVRVQGKASNADVDPAKTFTETLAGTIEEGGYVPQLIFNVSETGLFWKRLPSKSSIVKEESALPGFNVAKDRLTLLFGGNASGDLKLKPMLVYRTENPRALKGILKSTLPVLWKSNEKAWVTATLFEEWFSYHFVPEVKKYCDKNQLPFHAMLIINNAPSHPPILQHLHPNVKVVFLPLDTSLLQPMDQGVIAGFKAHYLRYTFAMLNEETVKEGGPTVMEFWESYNIYTAVKIIRKAWDDITEKNMKSAWKKLCPQFLNDSEDFESLQESVQKETEEIVKLANELNLNVSASDIDELLRSHSNELTNEELVAMQEEATAEKETDTVDETSITPKACLTQTDVNIICYMLNWAVRQHIQHYMIMSGIRFSVSNDVNKLLGI
ncbi:tigger transposable element-derived protein 1-like [Octopus sinensis]|uniref:Tigger transposable element-derived protein 1-like n=1 Tax=Octopus sinensis TaxID=2607531 RepID=A0A6P7TCS8_9MOLL|nr:tigger transposable element-derived protein 1-like [Octopus sinensis]